MKSSATISANTATTRAEMRFVGIQRSPSEGIWKAALCEQPSRKRHPHQRRIPNTALERAEACLHRIGRQLAKAGDFATPYGLVVGKIGGFKGIGALTLYDIAHGIGARFGKALWLVYLHAGTMTSSRVFNISGDSFDQRGLPKAFSRLAPYEIEDCLCIYKDELLDREDSRTACHKFGCAVALRQRSA
jgi:hypothetical protein